MAAIKALLIASLGFIVITSLDLAIASFMAATFMY